MLYSIMNTFVAIFGWLFFVSGPVGAQSTFTKYKISSTSTGAWTTTSTSAVDVTNATLTFVPSGRPVVIMAQHDGSATEAWIGCDRSGGGADCYAYYYIDRNGTTMALVNMAAKMTGTTTPLSYLPPGAISFVDTTATAGTSYTYKLRARVSAGTGYAYYMKLIAYSLP